MDNGQMHAAGMLEGYATASRIKEQVANTKYYFWQDKDVPSNVTSFLREQGQFVLTQAALPGNKDNQYWMYAAILQEQLMGLAEGAAAAEPSVTLDDLNIIQATGDLLNLIPVLAGNTQRPLDWNNEKVMEYFYKHSLCTGLIKVTPALDDLFAAHSAWFSYNVDLRIAKHYHFETRNQVTNLAARATSFSSYPGMLESLDDYYIMDSGLVMVQTTNAVFNMTIYPEATPQTMLSWQSVRIANALAYTGEEWAYLNGGNGMLAAGSSKQANGGYYANQYMILNLNKFNPGHAIVPGTLYVLDIIPGLWVGSDLSSILAEGYYGSYNVPYHTEIWTLSGYGEMVKKTGSQTFTYDLAPRAQIFRRNQTDVNSLDDLKALMRYNDYPNDPLSHNNPMDAICSRGDLVKGSPSPGGCYDSKCADLAHLKALSFDFVAGPTWGAQSGGNLPPFKWDPNFSQWVHDGIPNTFAFDFEPFTPRE